MERSSQDQAFLGIDAGGTKTDWVLLRSSGDELGHGSAPAAQLATHGAPRVAGCFAELFATAARAATAADAAIAAVAAGVAGAGTAEARAGLRAALADAGLAEVALAGDPEVAAAATLADAAGVALWAGTGSFAVARGSDDRLHRVGGRGWLLGDEGGAFDLVRRAAAAAVSAADGAAPATALGVALAAACDLPPDRLVELGRLLQGRPPGEVAQLYWQVQEAAAAGDAVATAVLDAGAGELARLAAAAARRAGLALATAPVWLGGGLLRRDRQHAERVCQALAAAGFGQPARLAERSAAMGAALLARALHRHQAPLCGWLPGDGA